MKTRLLVTMLVIGLAAGTHAANTSSFRSPSASGSSGNPIFVGTIESVNISNRTIVVSGEESVVATSYGTNVAQNGRNKTQTTNRNANPTSKPTRTLQATGKTMPRTFDVGGFCRIEGNEDNAGRMGKRLTVADLQVGQRVSVEFVAGIGDHYTAKFIQPYEALHVTVPNTKTPNNKKAP